MTENCSCGAAIKTWSKKWWLYWRANHTCNNQTETIETTTELSEQPIGFQPDEVP